MDALLTIVASGLLTENAGGGHLGTNGVADILGPGVRQAIAHLGFVGIVAPIIWIGIGAVLLRIGVKFLSPLWGGFVGHGQEGPAPPEPEKPHVVNRGHGLTEHIGSFRDLPQREGWF